MNDLGMMESLGSTAKENVTSTNSSTSLSTPAAEHAGFAHDGDLSKLVANALAAISEE